MSMMMMIAAANRRTTTPGGGEEPQSYAKEIQGVPESVALSTGYTYEAFGPIVRTGESRLTSFYRGGEQHVHGMSSLFYRHYNETTREWGSRVELYSDPTYPVTDCWGGRMDNDTICLFSATYDDGGTDNSVRTFRLILDLDMNILEDDDIVGGSIPSADYSWSFGTPSRGDTSGTFYTSLVQLARAGSSNDRTISCIKTTDNGVTWTEAGTIIDTDTTYSETIIWHVGAGRVNALLRVDAGANWVYSYSEDDGATWTGVGRCNMGTELSYPKIMAVSKTPDGLTDFILHDRDTECITASLDNDPEVYFGSATQFNLCQLITKNPEGGGIIGGLGYPWMEYLNTDDWNGERFYTFAKETGTYKSEIWYGVDDFNKTSAPVPPPGYAMAFTSDTYVVVDFTGYTSDQFDNIDHFRFDIATDEDFTTPAVGFWINPGVQITEAEITNVRWLADRLWIEGLDASTTYYLRVKAVNNYGESDYSTYNFTTSAP